MKPSPVALKTLLFLIAVALFFYMLPRAGVYFYTLYNLKNMKKELKIPNDFISEISLSYPKRQKYSLTCNSENGKSDKYSFHVSGIQCKEVSKTETTFYCKNSSSEYTAIVGYWSPLCVFPRYENYFWQTTKNCRAGIKNILIFKVVLLLSKTQPN